MVYTQTWEPCYFITCETTKKKLVVIRVSLSFGSHKVLYVKKQKVCKQHLVPELLCRCEIGLLPELIGKHVHTGWFVYIHVCMM